MSVTERIASLAPEQRALFEKLREKQRQAAARPPQPPPIPRRSGPTGEGDWPLSLDQERFWFMEQLYPDGAGLNIGAATRMRGLVAVPVIEAGLDEIVRRHAAWRASFPVVDGRPVQRVVPSRRQSLVVIDLAGLPETRREPEALRLVEEETAAPFDLANGPLVRSSLVRLAPRDHICLLTIHHLVTDFLSFQIVWMELAALIDAFSSGRPAALPEPPVQYPDFSVWQREWLQGEVLEGLVSWWRERLEGFPRALDLPTDRPRPAVARLRGGRREVEVPRGLSTALRAFARGEGATVFMAVLAAAATLLHRDSGQERLILGANNANRNRPEIEPVLGCFLTQVPFPIDLSGDPGARELLARVRQSALGSYAHQDLPFGKLVEAIQLPRDTSRQPLVQALVQVLDAQASGASLAGVAFEAVDSYDNKARYDLLLTLFDSPDGLNGSLEYDSDLYDPATVERMIGRLLLQIEAVTAGPDLPLSALPVLSAGERQQALVEWNDTARPLPDRTVPERLAAIGAASPDATALVAGEETLTWGELGCRSDALARRLRAAGARRESRVALLLDRGLEAVVAMLAVWKAGGAIVPLDLSSPAERMVALLADAEPEMVVHRGPLPVAPPPGAVPFDLAAPGEAGDGETPLPSLAFSDLAYLIYTSGTTGRPKAVMVEHGGLAAMMAAFQRLFGLRPDDRMVHMSAFTFDASVFELLAPLLAGGVCEMLGREEVLEIAPVLDALERATRFVAVPSLLRRIIEAVRERGVERFRHLRTVWTGGEAVTPDLQEELLATFPSAEVGGLYGPAETTVFCSIHRVPRGRRPERSLIGPPLDNVEFRVVDARGVPVPPGVPGELWIGGAGVSRGYFRRDDLTAERFVQVEGRRFYRSGDLVRQVYAEGGIAEFLGRTDHQVKVRGFRVEPGEIEAVLLDHPGVREAVVVARPDPGGDNRLVAYVAPETAPAAELRERLASRLPAYMVPSALVPLPALPLTPHGKIDRGALPEPAAREPLGGSALPRDAREELLAGIWSEVLGVERVGVHDNFFQLGGDSILSIQVVARARRAGLLISTRQFFEHQTIAGLAAVAEVAGEASGADQAPVTGEAPLTPIQRRFLAEGRREPWRFNQAVLLAPRERLETAALAASLERLVRHHDALRLRFHQEDGAWRQVHAPEAAVPLCEVDLRALPEGELVPALEAAAERLQAGLDLARGPLFTAALFRLGEEDRLLLTAHHLVVDGVSWRVLLEDLAAAELPPKTTSWKRWAELLAAHARSPELAAEVPYWVSLPAVPPLPVDAEGEGGRATVTVELGEAETRALLQEAPEAYRTQVNDLLLAALARAFAAWTGESALLVDLEGHGREEIFPGVDLSRTVGWFTTTFPVALPAEADPRTAILAVKETLRAVPGRGLGFGLLRWLADPETGERMAALPIPQVSFNYLGQLDGSVGEGGPFAFAPETVRGVEGEAVPGRPLFAIDALVLGGRLRANWTCDPGRHLPATVERLAEGFLAEVAALTAHCLSPEAGGFTPSNFPLARLDQAALDRLVGNDRGVEDLYPLAPLQEGILVHSLYTAGADVYFEQLTAELEGPLDPPVFAAAWEQVVERHPVLRTGFLWRDVERPLQLVRRSVELPWTAEDWRDVPAGELEARWRDLLAADRARGFDLGRPPLMRLALVRTAGDRHRLVWSSHHLLFDGWCFSLLLGEVFALLQREPLPPPPRPYRDYIAWLAGRDEVEAERWWRERLAGFTVPTPVPFDHPEALGGRHAGRADEYFERVLTLPAARAGALESAAQELRVTLNTLVQAAWALLLSRWSGETDVTFGAITSGRPAELPGVETMVGLFINSLPVRVEIPAAEPVSSWLARLQAEQFELRQHEWTPLSRIQELSGLPAAEPLFASLLAFENYPMAPAASEVVGELHLREAALGELTSYPLTLIAAARGELSLRLIADRRFEPVTVQRLLAQVETLLEGLAADPQAPPESLPLLTAAERHQLVVEWNDTASGFPAASIPALFLEQAALRPAAVAVELGEERLTYGELRSRAERVARRLLARGLRPGERVAVPAERSLDLIPTLLGVLLAGGAYLPVDPTWPADRLTWMARDAGASLPPEEDAPEAAGELPGVPAEAVAYVIYTSGSTGDPKGVAVTHRNAVRLVRGSRFARMGPEETWLQLSPVSFDTSILEIWGPLLNGGRVVLFPGRIGSLEEIGRVIAEHGVTSAWLTAGLFHEMVDGNLEGLRPLRQLLAGGDVVSAVHARRALAALPGLTLIDGYGPTECATFVSTHRMTDPSRIGMSVPIGRPVENDRLYVLDASLGPLPAGAWGELYAGGAGVSLGYLGRPELTAERFVPDPFGEPGARLYRTGDRARWSLEGLLEFQGRADSQLKIRGFRIEPGEVEAALLALPGVERGAVVGAGPVGGKALAAFWVGEATMEELRAGLRRRLPEAMVPTVWVPLPELPLTRNGKVDRRALEDLANEGGRHQRSTDRVPPRNLLEERLVEAAAEVLGRDPGEIGVLDNFFDLGGHSLLATRFVSMLHSRWGIEAPIQLVFDTPHLAALADRIMDAELEELDEDLLASMLNEESPP